MKYLTITMMILFVTTYSIAEEAQMEPADEAQVESANETQMEPADEPGDAAVTVTEDVNAELGEPVLPEKNSIEYWIIRSQAMTELIPFLTSKRAEIKTKRKLLADYLLEIGKATEFAELKMPVKYDGKLYAEVLQIDNAYREANIEFPKERPSWDEVVEIAMKYEVFEGYWPTDVEEGDEATMYIEICKKKEEYGQKVRQDGISVLDQTVNMWRYLDSIGELNNFKAHAADLALQQQAAKAQEKAMYEEMHREAVIQRAADREQRKFEDAEARASFRSSRRERAYESREARLRYRQSRLDERYINSRAYYY